MVVLPIEHETCFEWFSTCLAPFIRISVFWFFLQSINIDENQNEPMKPNESGPIYSWSKPEF